MNRGFKGVFIPKELYLDTSLSWTEKILIIEIDSLDNSDNKRENGEDKGCYASNQYLADFIGLTEASTKNMISKLKQSGWITQLWFDGRNRGLRVKPYDSRGHKNMTAEVIKKLQQTPQKNDQSNKESSILSDSLSQQGNPIYAHAPAKREKTEEAETGLSLPTSSIPNEDAFGAAHDFPLRELYAAFPDIELLPAQIGMIKAAVKKSDKKAWLATIEIYEANFNPARKQYMPEKVGNLLSVFRAEKLRLEKESANGKKNSQLPTADELIKQNEEWKRNRTYELPNANL